ncbi:NUDIX hydrolase [Candidatus Izemoplasma sp. B36]|uniref:NUDIX hydrolase n=1 Tax=Candidatus Izemoplasma sp. B36 TaxID=3242468 RepID=UPI003556F1D1
MKKLDVVYACITNGLNEVLMVYNCDANQWSLPGGKVEALEFLDEALIREVKEETGFEVKVNGLISVNERQIFQSNEHAIFFTFNCEIIAGRKIISHPEEISKIEWKTYKEADKLMPYFKKSIKETLNHSIDYTNQGKY